MKAVIPQVWEDSIYILLDFFPEIKPTWKRVIVCALPFTDIILSNPPSCSVRCVLRVVTEAQKSLATHPRSHSPWLKEILLIYSGVSRVTVLTIVFVALNMLIKSRNFANLVRYYFVSYFYLHADCQKYIS